MPFKIRPWPSEKLGVTVDELNAIAKELWNDSSVQTLRSPYNDEYEVRGKEIRCRVRAEMLLNKPELISVLGSACGGVGSATAGYYTAGGLMSYSHYQQQLAQQGAPMQALDKVNQKNQKKKGNIMSGLKEYFEKNKDLIYSIGLIVLVDHFIFKGAFREKIKAMVETFCTKTHAMIEAKNEPKQG